jgi:hypothetical protein
LPLRSRIGKYPEIFDNLLDSLQTLLDLVDFVSAGIVVFDEERVSAFFIFVVSLV